MTDDAPHLELWLVRHGQTTANLNSEFSGHTDVRLTEKGEAEARGLRPLLAGTEFDGVWSSDLQRAVNTARLAHSEPTPDPRLRELDFGELEGRRWDELEDTIGQALIAFDGFQAPGGESTATFERRVLSFVEALPPGRHLLVAHGGVVRLLSRKLGLDRFLPNGVVVAVDWTDQKLLFVKEPESAPEKA